MLSLFALCSLCFVSMPQLILHYVYDGSNSYLNVAHLFLFLFCLILFVTFDMRSHQCVWYSCIKVDIPSQTQGRRRVAMNVVFI